MYGEGLLVGLVTFLMIGVFHVIVIKTEYYLTKRVWPVFLALGILFLMAAARISNVVVSSTIAILGITCLWSIKELFEQEERVKKGWFPANPLRKKSAVQKEGDWHERIRCF